MQHGRVDGTGKTENQPGAQTSATKVPKHTHAGRPGSGKVRSRFAGVYPKVSERRWGMSAWTWKSFRSASCFCRADLRSVLLTVEVVQWWWGGIKVPRSIWGGRDPAPRPLKSEQCWARGEVWRGETCYGARAHKCFCFLKFIKCFTDNLWLISDSLMFSFLTLMSLLK